MALARVKTWIPGDVLTAADLNGEFNNVLNNPISLVSPTTGPINFNLQAHTNLLPSAITASSGTAGQVLTVSGGSAVWANNNPGAVSRTAGLVGTLSSQSGTFAVDAMIMRTTGATQSWTMTATSSFGASVATAGPAAGGRDIAGAFASTYVHWYAISTGANSTAPNGLVSSNPPNIGPVAMPTSYTGWTYLGGSVYSSASTTLVTAHRFRGDQATYDTQALVLAGGTSTVEASIGLGTAFPANASNYHLVGELTIQSGAGGASLAVLELRYVTGVNALAIKQQAPISNAIFNTAAMTFPNVSQSLFYVIDSQLSSANITAQSANVWVLGYQNPGVV